MDRGTVFVLSLLVLLVATFLPVNIQEAEASRPTRVRRSARAKKECPPYELPVATVGNYTCNTKRVDKTNKFWCKLVCPDGMETRPKAKEKIHFRCPKAKGFWVTPKNLDTVHCAWSQPVELVKQNLAPPAILNSVINLKMDHCHRYLAMAFFFDRGDVQLPGFHKFFLSMWRGCLDASTSLMKYVNKRGGFLDLQDLRRPGVVEQLRVGQEGGHVGLVALETALAMERDFHQHVLTVADRVDSFKKANKKDPHLVHMLEHDHMRRNVKLIRKLGDYITRLRAFKTEADRGEGQYELGEYELDSNLQ